MELFQSKKYTKIKNQLKNKAAPASKTFVIPYGLLAPTLLPLWTQQKQGGSDGGHKSLRGRKSKEMRPVHLPAVASSPKQV